jgi:hypothetical protein
MTGSLRIAKNLKRVIYDERAYEVAQVVQVSNDLKTNTIIHPCNGYFNDSLDLDFTVKLRRRFYNAAFCNRCKKLFLKEVQK